MLFAMLLAATALLPRSAAAQGAPAGSITAMMGDVDLVHAGTTGKAALGKPVYVGDKLITHKSSSVSVTLSDKSRLEIGELSQVTLDTHQLAASGVATTRVGLMLGIVRSFVGKTVGAAPPNYEVHTPNAVAAARGTEYDVDYQQGVVRKEFKGCTRFTDVAVFEGTVGVSNPTATSTTPVEVHKGYKSIVPCALIPTVPAVIGAAAGAAAGTTAGTTAAAAAAGAAAVAGGVVGGVAASGGFSGSNNASPSQ